MRTSWQKAGRWYDRTVGGEGHYYHQKIVIPGALRLLQLDRVQKAALLDLACGQGVLARRLDPQVDYQGFDSAPALIEAARKRDCAPNHRYALADVTRPLPLPRSDFTHAAALLALQNVEHPDRALANAGRHMRSGGRLVLVLNHPCFRIPRQSSWGLDEANKMRFRRVNRYLSPLKIPIKTNPSQGQRSPVAWSFHHPLSDFVRWLSQAGFLIELLEEWASDKESQGAAARMENLSRAEIPLFLALAALKR